MTYSPKLLTIGVALNGFYAIPKFQRPFAWTAAQVEDLLTDVFSAPTQTKKDGYFLGSIVTIRKNDETSTRDEPFSLIDGQQRLTTIGLVFMSLLPMAEAETTGDTESRKERVVTTKQVLRARERDAATGHFAVSARLMLQPSDAEVYVRLLEDFSAAEDLAIADHCIVIAVQAIRQQIAALRETDPYKGDPEFASNMIDLLSNSVNLVRINADSESAAFRLFEAMNDRGLDLSAADLIKNKLLSRCHPTDTDVVLKDWEETLAWIGPADLIGFLRTYWIATQEFVRKDKLYDEYKKHLNKQGPSEIKAFAKGLAKAAAHYAEIEDPAYLPKKAREMKRVLTRLGYYGAKTFRPALLAAKIFHESDLNFQLRVARLCESITVRWSVVGKMNPNKLENVYSELAKNIRANTGLIVELVPGTSLATVPSDTDFRMNFVAAQKIPAKQWQAVLEALNWQLEEGDVELDLWGIKGIHLEHILPQSPLADGLADYGVASLEEAAKWAHHVGNLTLLGGARNRGLSNSSFEKKRGVFKGSGIAITRDIADRYSEWTPVQIAERAGRLAELAIDFFSLKYNED